jgi:hypothetical protein
MYVTKTEILVHFNTFTGNIFKYKNICDAAKWFYYYYSLPNTWVFTEEKLVQIITNLKIPENP